jgi:hypothetical protein
MITNFSDEALTVPKATVLGIAESIVDRINREGQSSFDVPLSPTVVKRIRRFFRSYSRGN